MPTKMIEKNQILTYLEEVAKNDSQESFRKLYNHYYTRLFRQALYYLTNQPDAAQEVVSDVFIAVWQGRKVLDKVKDPDAYLFIAIKHASSAYVARSYKEKRELLMENLPDTNYHSDNKSDFALLDAELQIKYEQALSKLPPRCAEVFKLVREDRRKYAEVAEMLGVSVKTVDNQMGKAIKILYKELRENLFSVFF